MTHCVEYYKKWRQEPNFCGLGPAGISAIDRYFALVDELMTEHGLDELKIYDKLPQSTVSPLRKFSPDTQIRKDAIKKVVDTIKQDKRVTSKDVELWIYSGTEIHPQEALKIKTNGREKKKINLPPTLQSTGETINKKIYALKTFVLTSGQNQILRDVMVKYNKDNEIAALAQILIWAKERMESE